MQSLTWFFCFLVSVLAVSEPILHDHHMQDPGLDYNEIEDIPLGTPDEVTNIPGEALNPDDFMRAEKIEVQAPERDSINGDPLEMAGLFEGDIAGVPQDSVQGDLYRNAIKDMSMRWEGGIIPYVVSASFTAYERSVIAKAFKEYENKTCIRFIPRTNQRDYINIYEGSGCSSNVGRTTGNQPVSLGKGCMYVGIVIHELMHAAGFWHEQSRTDRDDHITINWSNIQDDMQYNFQKYSLDRIQYLNAPYDTGSVMHYDAYAFAKDRNTPTIIPKDRSQADKLGQRFGFSKIDLLKLNTLYKCKTESGVVVPPPTTTAPPVVTPELPGVCTDSNKYCAAWAESGECEKNKAWMSIGCRKSCNTCNEECTDTSPFCKKWTERGECNHNPEYMNIYCAKSCKTCIKKGQSDSSCEDHNRYCTAWANRGQCDVNPDYMLTSCKRSCDAC